MAYLGNISAPVNQGEISANNDELSAMKKKNTETMDINEAHYKMEHMGEAALRKLLNHHKIKATGKFENCVSCMNKTRKLAKWPQIQQNIQESDYTLMQADRFHYQWAEKSIG
jgi:hypothetical protein